MLDEIVPVLKNFRDKIYRFFPSLNDAAMELVDAVIGTPAKPPKPRKKAPGRKLGDIQIKRLCHAIVKKRINKPVDEKMVV